MSYLKNADTNTLITRFVSLEEKQEVIRTAQTLLSGGVYIQRIGEPTVSYAVTAYVNRTGKAQLLTAEDTAALLSVSVKHGDYHGRVTELSFSERMAEDWFKATLTLAKEVEVE